MPPDSNRLDSLIADLVAAMRRGNLSRRAVADRCFLHINTLNKFGKDGWNPNYTTLKKLMAGLLASNARANSRPSD